MKKILFGTAAAVLALSLAGNAHAQVAGLPLSIEVRGGAAFPTGDDFGSDEAGAETGYGFGANVFVGLTPLLGIYGGYSQFEFGADVDAVGLDFDFPAGADVDYRDNGFNLGAQVTFSPLSSLSGVTPWLRGGATLREFEIEVEDADVESSVSTDRDLGFEAGGGLNIPLGEVISVTPGVRYVSFDPEFDEDQPFEVRYIVADVGLQIRF